MQLQKSINKTFIQLHTSKVWENLKHKWNSITSSRCQKQVEIRNNVILVLILSIIDKNI